MTYVVTWNKVLPNLSFLISKMRVIMVYILYRVLSEFNKITSERCLYNVCHKESGKNAVVIIPAIVFI